MNQILSWNLILAVIFVAQSTFAHVDHYPSVHDTVVTIQERLIEEKSKDQLLTLSHNDLEAFLTDQEKDILGNGHIRFTINIPITLYLLTDVGFGDRPFWIQDRGFEKTSHQVEIDGDTYQVWQKEFEAGRIGLGVNSLQGGGDHYVAALKAKSSEKLEITDVYPGQAIQATMAEALQRYGDDDTSIPEMLKNTQLILGRSEWRDNAKLLQFFRETRFPASDTPDQIVLTWSDDPKTTQTIQWRTSTIIKQGRVAYMKKSDFNNFNSKKPNYVWADTQVLETLDIVNDPVIHRHTAVIRNLEPDTTYVYAVGDASDDGWNDFSEFTTAPDRVEPFSFIYMGDAQNGLDRWGTLVQNAFNSRPDAQFYIMAGDLVNRGNERWDWDDFFYNAEGIYNQRQLVPAIGNHEDQGTGPHLYLKMFDLFKNGPSTIQEERAYSFEYSNALFVILDTNLSAADQTEWLEVTLANSDATWKFVVYHHPAYSSAPNRNNEGVRELWTPIFDKYHVDMALQGHDHAYLRTYPMKNQEPVEDASDGTIYIVSVSGTKMYDQGDFDYKAFGMTNVSTYQVLDIQISGDRLLYRSYDIDGNLRDDIEIVK